MRKKQKTNNVVYFKHWTRKNYAVFRSLHRIVAIYTLSAACSILTCPGKAQGQDTISQTRLLEEIEVREERPLQTDNAQMVNLQLSVSKAEIERREPQSLTNLLEHLQGLDIRQRGAFGTQADISFRGGNFDQTAVFLNGINFTDPQTGHYSLNLPISPDVISKIEIFKNTAPYLFGSSSFSGMINLLTSPDNSNSLVLSAGGGMYGLARTGITGNFASTRTRHLLHVDYERSDGYTRNTDFKNLNLFYFGSYLTSVGKFESQAGFANRNYGANGFYSLKYPNQHDSTQTFLASIRFVNKGAVKVIPSVYYRYQADCYELVKGQPRQRNNFHRSQVLGGNILSSFSSKLGNTSFVVDYKIENIASTGLGNLLDSPIAIHGEDSLFYRYGYTRQHYGAGASHRFSWRHFSGNFAFNVQHNTDNYADFYYLPSLNLAYRFTSGTSGQTQLNQQIYLSAGKTMRMPTFTDLFYHTGDILGNQNLKPEEAITFELGYNYQLTGNESQQAIWDGQACMFRRYGQNLIDFIKAESDSVWHSVNHTEVTTTGVEVSTSFHPQSVWGSEFFITDISLRYAYLHSDKKDDGYLSRYVLDYLRHKFTFSLTHNVIRNLSVNYTLTCQSRVGSFQNKEKQYESYPDYVLFDVVMQYQHRNWKFRVEANNVLDTQYFDIGGLVQPGFWIMGGVQYRIATFLTP